MNETEVNIGGVGPESTIPRNIRILVGTLDDPGLERHVILDDLMRRADNNDRLPLVLAARAALRNESSRPFATDLLRRILEVEPRAIKGLYIVTNNDEPEGSIATELIKEAVPSISIGKEWWVTRNFLVESFNEDLDKFLNIPQQEVNESDILKITNKLSILKTLGENRPKLVKKSIHRAFSSNNDQLSDYAGEAIKDIAILNYLNFRDIIGGMHVFLLGEEKRNDAKKIIVESGKVMPIEANRMMVQWAPENKELAPTINEILAETVPEAFKIPYRRRVGYQLQKYVRYLNRESYFKYDDGDFRIGGEMQDDGFYLRFFSDDVSIAESKIDTYKPASKYPINEVANEIDKTIQNFSLEPGFTCELPDESRRIGMLGNLAGDMKKSLSRRRS